MSDLLKIVTLAIAREIQKPHYATLDAVPGKAAARNAIEGLSLAAFDAIEKSGHRIVPVEPTDAMCAAAERIWPANEAYRAMLAAAPKVTP